MAKWRVVEEESIEPQGEPQAAPKGKWRVLTEPLPEEFSMPRYLAEKATQGALSITDLPQILGQSMPNMYSGEEDLIRDANGKIIGLRPPSIRKKEIPEEEMMTSRIKKFIKEKAGVDIASQKPTTRLQKTLGTGAEFIGGFAVPGLGAASKAGNIAKKGIQFGKGAALSGAMGTTAGGLEEMGIPAPVAAIASLAVPGGIAAKNKISNWIINPMKNYGKGLFGNKNVISKEVMQGLPASEIPEMLEAQEAGRRLGVTLTPAEASANPILAKTEGHLGVTPANEQALYEFKKGQKGAQKNAVSDLLSEISPSESVANEEARTVSKKIIDKKMNALQEKAEPYYQKSEHQVIPEEKFKEILKDSNIRKAYNEVISDPLYETTLEGFPKNSIKVLDQVKKNLNGKENNFYSNGYNEEGRIIKHARRKLVESLDNVSSDYKKARGIYSEDLPAVQRIKDSKVGKIANMSDDQIKNVSKTIFDANETDMKTFLRLRNDMMAEDPKVWNNIIRNEIERRLDQSKHLSSTGNHGSEFYSKVLASEKDFRKFYAALGAPNSKEVTVSQKKLADMRKAFRGLINSRTVKTAAGQSESKVNTARSSTGLVVEFYKRWVKGKYDKAAIEIITDPNWKQHLPSDVKKSIKGDSPRTQNELISALVAIEQANKTESEEQE